MNLHSFRITHFRSVLDSGWVLVHPLTVLVGKNEAGKTNLLRALSKFKPFLADEYNLAKDWPRHARKPPSPQETVCTVRFALGQKELQDLKAMSTGETKLKFIEVAKKYSGDLDVKFLTHNLDDVQLAWDAEQSSPGIPTIREPVFPAFRAVAQEILSEISGIPRTDPRGARKILNLYLKRLKTEHSSPRATQQVTNEKLFMRDLESFLLREEQDKSLLVEPEIKVIKYLLTCLPPFLYMSDVRASKGSVNLRELRQRRDSSQVTDEDRTILTILQLAELDLESLSESDSDIDKAFRQLQLDQASQRLSLMLRTRWRQHAYDLQLRVDGQDLFLFIRDDRTNSLVSLEERSKGFQWFLSFDLLFMAETAGTFKDCVILLDEPGLHLHPDAQLDLLDRLRHYAKANRLIYSTHLPFMVDVSNPEGLRVLIHKDGTTCVADNIVDGDHGSRLVLQAALGMSGRTNYLVSPSNLVVEGMHDFWILLELSRVCRKAGKPCLPEDVLVTPANGAPAAVYLGAFMLGQKLDVFVLLDGDAEGASSRDKFSANWLKSWSTSDGRGQGCVKLLSDCCNAGSAEMTLEDLFPLEFYVDLSKSHLRQDWTESEVAESKREKGGVVKRFISMNARKGKTFDKAKLLRALRTHLRDCEDFSKLPEVTQQHAESLFKSISTFFGPSERN